MNKQTKKAFTLVELIVVITILAILGTIAFISLQGYSRDARDTTRISDIKNIKTSLELFSLSTGFYPEPTGGVDITYSGALVRNEGTVGDSVIKNIEKINNKPVDPLTGNEYTYSRLNTKKEYELGAIIEGDLAYNPIITQANALDGVISYVNGTYNGVVAKVNTGSKDYVLAIPTIIGSDISDKDLIQILNKKGLAFDGYNNIPSSYLGDNYTHTGGFNYSPTNIVVFEGDVSELSDSGVLLKTFADNLQIAYDGSDIANSGIYADILSMDTSIESELINLAGNIVNNSFGVNFPNKSLSNDNTGDNVILTCADGNIKGPYFCPEANGGERFEFISGTTPGGTSIINDKLTGLNWLSSGYPSENSGYTDIIDHGQALSYCANLSLGGFDDWRLPDYTELNSIMDRTKVNPSIDTDFFTASTSLYWTSTTYADTAGLFKFSIRFSGGADHYSFTTADYYARCVR